jgi:hypothetical protein
VAAELPRPEPHLGQVFRGGSSLVEHWLFGPSVIAGLASTAVSTAWNVGPGGERAEHAVGS